MRFTILFIVLWALPGIILGNTYHVPNDYPLLQSAINASGNNDTIICDTVKDLDTIKITNKVNLAVQGASPVNPATISKVLLIKNSTCDLERLSFTGTKGVNGNNNNSCTTVPAMDGKAGADAVIIDSSTVTVSQCTIRGGDGGSYGVSYQNGMICHCGSKGIPGTALRAMDSHVSLMNDTLLSGQCSAISLAGCFTNNCTTQGFGCAGLNGSIIDTIHSRIDSMSLDSTSIAGPTTKIVNGRHVLPSAAIRHSTFVSVAGRIAIPNGFKTPYTIHVYNAQGKLVLYRTGVTNRQIDLGSKAAKNIYIVSLKSVE
jgi:hypothetical protein